MCKRCKSYRQEAGEFKDERRNANLAPDEMPYRKKSKGKLNKFCQKKPGQQHDFSVKVWKYETARWRAFVLACSRCHKQDWKSYTSQRLHTNTIYVGPEREPREYTYWV